MLYDAYLRYPRAFYDRHATGEVISRATNDIYPVRYFMGWGVVQAIQSMMMLVGAGIVLVLVNPMLALFAALAMPPIAILTYLFAHRVFPISREVQRRKGHLTEASDEAVVGIEMVQAFGREEDVRDRFHGRAEDVRRETMRQASVEARYLPGLIFLPTLGIAAVLLFGGRDVDLRRPHDRRVHAVHHPAAPARLAARGARLDHQPRPARDRLGRRSFAWLDGIAAARRSAATPTPLPAGPLARPLRGRPVRLRDRRRGAARRRPRLRRRARSSPSAARPARARRRC